MALAQVCFFPTTVGAVAFAGLLVVIMRSDEVRGFLLAIIRQALALP